MNWLLIPLGLVAGALINALADSLPQHRRPRAPSCAYCRQARPALAWSAILAYLTGKYRCPSCGAPISARSVIVELIAPLLFVFCWQRGGASVTTALHIVYGAILILIAVTDLEHRLIPHAITFPAIGVAVVGGVPQPGLRFAQEGAARRRHWAGGDAGDLWGRSALCPSRGSHAG